MKYIFLILVFCQSLTTRAQNSATTATTEQEKITHELPPSKHYLLRYTVIDSQVVSLRRPDSMTVVTDRTFDEDFVRRYLAIAVPGPWKFDRIEIILIGDQKEFDAYERSHKRKS